MKCKNTNFSRVVVFLGSTRPLPSSPFLLPSLPLSFLPSLPPPSSSPPPRSLLLSSAYCQSLGLPSPQHNSHPRARSTHTPMPPPPPPPDRQGQLPRGWQSPDQEMESWWMPCRTSPGQPLPALPLGGKERSWRRQGLFRQTRSQIPSSTFQWSSKPNKPSQSKQLSNSKQEKRRRERVPSQ